MSKSSQAPSGGVGFFGLLTVLFIGLKLTDQIDWSWWWVTSLLWLPALVVFTAIFLFHLLKALFK